MNLDDFKELRRGMKLYNNFGDDLLCVRVISKPREKRFLRVRVKRLFQSDDEVGWFTYSHAPWWYTTKEEAIAAKVAHQLIGDKK